MICEYAHACICWKGLCHVMCGVALSAIKLINKQCTHAAMKRAAQSLRPCCKTNTNWEWPVVYIYIFEHILSHVYTISNSCLSDISRWLRLAGSLNLQSAIYLLCSSFRKISIQFQREWQCQNCIFRPPGEKRMGLLIKSNWLKNWSLSQHPGFCKMTGILQRNCTPNKSWKTLQTKDHAIEILKNTHRKDNNLFCCGGSLLPEGFAGAKRETNNIRSQEALRQCAQYTR